MKKSLTIALLIVMLVMSLATVVNAATSANLADKLYEKGAAYGLTKADKVKIERYLSENPVSDETANAILAKADEVIAIMDEAGVKNYSKLTANQKSKIKAIATEAADLVDIQLVFKKGSVELIKDGKVIETITLNNGKLAYTGNNINVVLVVSLIAIIALAITVVAKKTFANA